jgi:hypothetical protein
VQIAIPVHKYSFVTCTFSIQYVVFYYQTEFWICSYLLLRILPLHRIWYWGSRAMTMLLWGPLNIFQRPYQLFDLFGLSEFASRLFLRSGYDANFGRTWNNTCSMSYRILCRLCIRDSFVGL